MMATDQGSLSLIFALAAFGVTIHLYRITQKHGPSISNSTVEIWLMSTHILLLILLLAGWLINVYLFRLPQDDMPYFTSDSDCYRCTAEELERNSFALRSEYFRAISLGIGWPVAMYVFSGFVSLCLS